MKNIYKCSKYFLKLYNMMVVKQTDVPFEFETVGGQQVKMEIKWK